MKIFQISVFDKHETMSDRAARWLAKRFSRVIAKRGQCVFVPSAGRTPNRVYEILRERYRDSLDWSRVVMVQMDEYAGAASILPTSFANYLYQNVAAPLGIEQFHTFFDEGGDLIRPFDATDRLIGALGGIDVVFFGVGENGHLGFNEPGASPDAPTGYVRLSDATLTSNTGRSLEEARNLLPSDGVTLGLSILLSARESLLIASGERKREALSSFISGEVSAASPFTYLRMRERVTIMITSDCAPQRQTPRSHLNAGATRAAA